MNHGEHPNTCRSGEAWAALSGLLISLHTRSSFKCLSIHHPISACSFWCIAIPNREKSWETNGHPCFSVITRPQQPLTTTFLFWLWRSATFSGHHCKTVVALQFWPCKRDHYTFSVLFPSPETSHGRWRLPEGVCVEGRVWGELSKRTSFGSDCVS